MKDLHVVKKINHMILLLIFIKNVPFFILRFICVSILTKKQNIIIIVKLYKLYILIIIINVPFFFILCSICVLITTRKEIVIIVIVNNKIKQIYLL